ncbi:hypothetical protein P43SY_000689 [Pythium insidiosum]|uniref:Secreted protein n=1 Tax=Pythium insidiosum TaxID=114742 RepID=A0AAD5LPM3_PYTIN|nr:hypothetical protein P43SY_000689 [Pythium insidiosum]
MFWLCVTLVSLRGEVGSRSSARTTTRLPRGATSWRLLAEIWCELQRLATMVPLRVFAHRGTSMWHGASSIVAVRAAGGRFATPL